MRQIRTKRGAVRRYNAIIARCRCDLRGGLQFGMDWPTLRAMWPDRYAEIQGIRTLYLTLRE